MRYHCPPAQRKNPACDELRRSSANRARDIFSTDSPRACNLNNSYTAAALPKEICNTDTSTVCASFAGGDDLIHRLIQQPADCCAARWITSRMSGDKALNQVELCECVAHVEREPVTRQHTSDNRLVLSGRNPASTSFTHLAPRDHTTTYRYLSTVEAPGS